MYFVLSTPLGAVLGIMTGVAVAGLMEGGEAVAFYIILSLVALLLLLFLVNFTNLTVGVGERELEFAFGLFRKRIRLDQVTSAAPADYRWTEYGGWGIRFALGGKRAWSVPGVKRGVLVTFAENGKERRYFISSDRPEALSQAVTSGLKLQPGAAPVTPPAGPVPQE
jgi:hypothetical protein